MASAIPKTSAASWLPPPLGMSSNGTTFTSSELAAILSVKFFDKTHPVAALLSTIALLRRLPHSPIGCLLVWMAGDRWAANTPSS